MALNPLLVHADGLARGDVLQFSLFDGKKRSAAVDRVSANINGTVTVRARIDGYPYGYLLVSTTDGNSLGSIRIPEKGAKYRIAKGTARSHLLLEMNAEALDRIEPSPPLLAPPPPSDDPGILGIQKQIQQAGLGPMDHATVGVMVVYTPAAKSWAGGSTGIANVIAQAMEKAQLALDNSGTYMDFALVHSAEVDYVESGSSSTDLTRLRTTDDGYMEEVHAWRDDYAADLVALFAEVADVGGVGYLLNNRDGDPDFGFSLTRVQQASSTYTHAHEMGHNMGLHHHNEQTVQPGPTSWFNWPENTWSAGWRWVGTDDRRYCSVMTYGPGSYFPDGQWHTVVAHFSNPDINHEGVPSGHATDGDNARTLREIKHVVAAYRTSHTYLPDFTVDSISISPDPVQEGENVAAMVVVRNRGDAAGDGGYLDVWYDAPDPVPDPSPGVYDDWKSVGNLNPGETREFTFEFEAPGPVGTKTFRAFVDSMDETEESSRSGNQMAENYTVVAIWTLSVQQPEGEGSTDPAIGDLVVNVGEGVQALATPASSWKFSHWVLDGNTIYENPTHVSSGENGQTKHLKPFFVPQEWTLLIQLPEGEGGTNPGIGGYDHNVWEHREVFATPAEEWRLGHWLLGGEDAGRDNPINIAPGEDGDVKTLQAVFEPVPNLHVAKSAGQEAVNPGHAVAFAIEFGNFGSTDARGVVISETLPANAHYVPDSATDGGIYDEAARTVTWHVGELAAGTLGRTVGFQVTADEHLEPGDTLVNADYSIECEDTDARTGDPVEIEVVDDEETPSAFLQTPRPSTVLPPRANQQAPRDTLVVVEVSDDGSGVVLDTVRVWLNGELIYDGSDEAPEGGFFDSGLGRCRRSGTSERYRFSFFRSRPAPDNPGRRIAELYPHGQEYWVRVEAEDRAGNRLAALDYSDEEAKASAAALPFQFRTQDREFGQPFRVNAHLGGVEGRPAVAKDGDGNLWAAWAQDAEGLGRRTVWTSTLAHDAAIWGESVPVAPGADEDQRSPALAVAHDGGRVLALWEQGPEGGSAVYASWFDGDKWSAPEQVSGDGVAASPAAAATRGGDFWAAWQERTANPGAWDIRVAAWDGEWDVADITGDAGNDQTQPALAADANHAYAVWVDGASGGEVHSASSDDCGTHVLLVENAEAGRPALAAEFGDDAAETRLHLAWDQANDEAPDVQDVHYAAYRWDSQQIAFAAVTADATASQTRPSVAVRGAGPLADVFVAWQCDSAQNAGGGAEGDEDVFFAEKSVADAAFGTPVYVAPSPSAQASPALAVGPTGPPTAFWTEAGNLLGAGGRELAELIWQGLAQPGAELRIDPDPHPDTGHPGIVVPPHAVSEPREINIRPVETPPAVPPPAGIGIGIFWDFGPSQEFDAPVTIRMPVTPEDMEGLSEPYRVFWFDTDTNQWSEEGIADVAYDAENGWITFTTTHFTEFTPTGSLPGVPTAEPTPAARGGGGGGGCSMAHGVPRDMLLLLLPAASGLALGIRKKRKASN